MSMTQEQLVEHIDKVTKDYKGDITVLYSAIGVLSLGESFGWRVLRITLGSPTYTKYQRILGIDFKTQFPERGRYAHKSLGLKIADQTGNFWNVVKGIESINHVEKKSLA
jgi:hypothetical protein